MTIAREEVVLLALVLLAGGLLCYGMLEVVWPRARREKYARRAERAQRLQRLRAQRRLRAARRRVAPRAPAAPPASSPSPPAVVPPLRALEPPAKPMSAEELLEQIGYLAGFPLRALVLLRRADALVDAMPAGEVYAEALRLRLGMARAAIGCALVDAGLAEPALTPLTQVVSGNGLPAAELQRARAALSGALAKITDERAQAARRVAQEGNAASALTHADRLAALLRGAIDSGLTETELAAPLATAQRLFVHLGVRRLVVKGRR